MKIRILDRILVALAGLLMLAGCAALGAQLFFGKDVIGWVSGILHNESLRVWLIIALVLLLALGCYCLLVLFRHRGRRGKFINQKTDNGELDISLSAMESMVQKCLDQHKELAVTQVHLENRSGSLGVEVFANAAGGISIPLSADLLEQQIKQYVTACSGVEVKDIRIQIDSMGEDAKDAFFAVEAPAFPALLNEAQEKQPEDASPADSAAPMTPEEIEQVLAETPPPQAEESGSDDAPVVVPAAAAAAAELLRSEAPAEEDDRPIHQRLFSSPEEPCVMPMPPEDLTNGNGTDSEAKSEAEKAGTAETETADADITETEKTEAVTAETEKTDGGEVPEEGNAEKKEDQDPPAAQTDEEKPEENKPEDTEMKGESEK